MADQTSVQAAIKEAQQQGQGTGIGSSGKDVSTEQSLGVALTWINRDIHEKDIMKKAAELGLPYIYIAHVPINADLLSLVTKEDVLKVSVMPFMRIGKHLRVAVVDPNNAESLGVIQKWSSEGIDVEMNLCSQEGLTEAVKVYDAQRAVVQKELVTSIEDTSRSAFEKEIALLADLKSKIETVSSDESLNLIEVGAMKTGASDMHFEPSEKSMRVRFRIDGVLHPVFELSRDVAGNVINQLKYKCRMKMNIANVPQDGRYSFELNGRKIDVRVSSIPTQYGESFVCRLLDSGKSFLSFEEMGFQGRSLEKMNALPGLSHGMILVTGPTGSGKTTTLYSLLTRFALPESKVITLEDPIEYHLDGISQSQINESA